MVTFTFVHRHERALGAMAVYSARRCFQTGHLLLFPDLGTVKMGEKWGQGWYTVRKTVLNSVISLCFFHSTYRCTDKQCEIMSEFPKLKKKKKKGGSRKGD